MMYYILGEGMAWYGWGSKLKVDWRAGRWKEKKRGLMRSETRKVARGVYDGKASYVPWLFGSVVNQGGALLGRAKIYTHRSRLRGLGLGGKTLRQRVKWLRGRRTAQDRLWVLVLTVSKTRCARKVCVASPLLQSNADEGARC